MWSQLPQNKWPQKEITSAWCVVCKAKTSVATNFLTWPKNRGELKDLRTSFSTSHSSDFVTCREIMKVSCHTKLWPDYPRTCVTGPHWLQGGKKARKTLLAQWPPKSRHDGAIPIGLLPVPNLHSFSSPHANRHRTRELDFSQRWLKHEYSVLTASHHISCSYSGPVKPNIDGPYSVDFCCLLPYTRIIYGFARLKFLCIRKCIWRSYDEIPESFGTNFVMKYQNLPTVSHKEAT